jgi:hypothetical protein
MSYTYAYTEDHPQKFVAAFNQLASTKNTQIDDLKQEAYFRTLSGLPIDAVEHAAKVLAEEASPYMPDAGTWYAKADTFASESINQSIDDGVKQLSSGRNPQDDELDRIIKAREKFVTRWESLVGQTLPDDHFMKASTPNIPTFGCSTCRDIGWVEIADAAGDMRAKHCICWGHNPVLLRRRSTAKTKHAKHYGGGVT